VKRTISAVMIAALLVPLPALAKHGDKGNGKADRDTDTSRRDNDDDDDDDHDRGRDATNVNRFGPEQRDRARTYFAEKHGHGNCPPGLAKKHNGCLPPGQAKKQYSVGQPLPETVRVEAVPTELRVRIGDPPRGYRYVIVDGDLVKLAIGTALVVDAVDGLIN
jgi:Ni/Co efflux regulator RcnB